MIYFRSSAIDVKLGTEVRVREKLKVGVVVSLDLEMEEEDSASLVALKVLQTFLTGVRSCRNLEEDSATMAENFTL